MNSRREEGALAVLTALLSNPGFIWKVDGHLAERACKFAFDIAEIFLDAANASRAAKEWRREGDSSFAPKTHK